MPLETFEINSWESLIDEEQQTRAVQALESGGVLYFPNLPFLLQDSEYSLLTPTIMAPKAKNISYSKDKDLVTGSNCEGAQAACLRNMIRRYGISSRRFLEKLIPTYNLIEGRTSFRPAEIEGRKVLSRRKDDTLLHVDSFPSTPTQGQRILRIFTNINPEKKARVWRLGEPFENVVQQMAPRASPPIPGMAHLLKWLGITKKQRTPYDHYMLEMHNIMKEDSQYQQTVTQEDIHFPAGSTWIVFTDLTSHAAMAGQYVLELTCYLPIESQWDESLSPLRQLERHFGRALR